VHAVCKGSSLDHFTLGSGSFSHSPSFYALLMCRAHLGVIRALHEAGVCVDLVGGTSQGAFVGALFAATPDDIKYVFSTVRRMAREMSSIRNKLFDLTLPITSAFSGRLFNRSIRKFLGKMRIQDLVLNYFCVSHISGSRHAFDSCSELLAITVHRSRLIYRNKSKSFTQRVSFGNMSELACL
jgi:hypothetical protein